MTAQIHAIYHHLLAAEAALIASLESVRDGANPHRDLGESLVEIARAQSRLADLLRNPASPGLAGVAKPSGPALAAHEPTR